MQMKKRKVVPDFKVGGNYYPITCAAYIEDWQHRLTLLTRQAFGFSSIRSGMLHSPRPLQNTSIRH